jgi:ABC-type lipoprotein export system ATPase subunit
MLQIKNLTKGFRNHDGHRIQVVDVESFNLEKGTAVAIQGESGSGKSTFLNLIAGILEPDEGEIELNGVALHELTESQRDQLRAKSIGYIFQSFHLLPGYSALENLLIAMTWGGEVDESKARGLLDAVGLSKRIHYLPDQLSLGQQQRVALARALVNEPQLILADEPTGNLDSLNSKASMELIKDLTAANNASLLVVSHDPQIISSFENNVIWEKLNSADSLYLST